MQRIAAFVSAALSIAGMLEAQTVKWKPDEGLPPPPLTYHGLMPGISTMADLLKARGQPLHENKWYAYKMVYPGEAGRSGHTDAVYLELNSKDRLASVIGDIEAATVPDGFGTWAEVRARLGEPEFYLELHRQSCADYSVRGVRFFFNLKGDTIGVAYIPHGKSRVPSGARRFLSLRGLPQGPQPAPAQAPDMAGMRAGAAEADFTPPDPAWLGPAAKKGEFLVHDPLKARCAVFERGDLRVAIVGADLFGMSKSEIDPIEAALQKEGIGHLIVAMSHNHAAADTIGIYGHYPAEYVRFIQDRIREGVLAAAKGLRPVKRWKAASDELPLDGARVEGLSRNARNPGIVDPQLAVLQAIGEDGKPIVTLAHFACHVEGLEKGILETSADFPGYLCESLKTATGSQAIFLNGAVGGMVSGDTLARTHEESRKAGERLAREAVRLLDAAASPARMRFSLDRYRLEIPVTNPKFILFAQMAGRRPLFRGRIVTEMMHLRLGDAEIITIPGELLPEVSFEILERMRGYPRMLLGLANDQIGYLLPGYDFNAGEYEESMSVGPAGGPMVLQQALYMIEKAAAQEKFTSR